MSLCILYSEQVHFLVIIIGKKRDIILLEVHFVQFGHSCEQSSQRSFPFDSEELLSQVGILIWIRRTGRFCPRLSRPMLYNLTIMMYNLTMYNLTIRQPCEWSAPNINDFSRVSVEDHIIAKLAGDDLKKVSVDAPVYNISLNNDQLAHKVFPLAVV